MFPLYPIYESFPVVLKLTVPNNFILKDTRLTVLISLNSLVLQDTFYIIDIVIKSKVESYKEKRLYSVPFRL